MFESLSEKLTQSFRNLRGMGKISEANVDEACKQVRFALLEADVHFKVAKTFVARVKEKTMGAEVLKGLEPAHQFIQSVHDELVEIMGRTHVPLARCGTPPTVIMMAGLQGSGKTTTTGKIAKQLGKDGRRCLLVACDLQRPAAIDQLETLAKQVGADFYGDRDLKDPVLVARAGLARARELVVDTVLFDTAGRLHINDELMRELGEVKAAIGPHEVLLVVDAMTGQDAVKVAESFDARLDIQGVVLTKLDGDTRGGAALSIREVTGKPIKYVGMGEKLDQLTVFHPDRMASRILNMGDVLSLVEKVQGTYSEDEMQSMQKKMLSGDFDLQDFYDQLQAVKRMGPMKDVLKMMPGMGQMLGQVSDEDLEKGNKEMGRKEAIICSMTMKERRKPELLNASRKRRVAKGSGVEVQDINLLLKEFQQMRKMMGQMKGLMKQLQGGKMPRMPGFPGGFPGGGFRK